MTTLLVLNYGFKFKICSNVNSILCVNISADVSSDNWGLRLFDGTSILPMGKNL